MIDLVGHIHKNIRQRELFQRGKAILVAVSGGVDSMVLLYLLHTLAQKERWKVTVAHLNHQLRGRASGADERFVRATARKLGLPFVIGSADVRLFARSHKISIEMAARKLRHDFLAREAVRLKIQTVALAHHADDQLELFFLRLLRGSGGEGLAGMKWRSPSPGNRKIVLVRPLLDLPKKELKHFATGNVIRFREDASNDSLEFQRNRIRHELLPLLAKHYQKSLDKVILRVAEVLGAEADFVTQCALDWLAQMESSGSHRSSSGKIAFRSAKDFAELPVALQRRIIQLQSVNLGLPVDFETVENLRLNPESSINVSAENSVLTSLSRDFSGRILLSTQTNTGFQANSEEVLLLNNSGKIVFDGLCIQWRKQSGNALKGSFPRQSQPEKPRDKIAVRHVSAHYSEYFDADKVGASILLRHWKAGDRFTPIGMQHAIKLQDFFTNEKIPRNKRRHLAMGIAENGEIFWVEGLRISENFKVSITTKKLLEWRWQS